MAPPVQTAPLAGHLLANAVGAGGQGPERARNDLPRDRVRDRRLGPAGRVCPLGPAPSPPPPRPFSITSAPPVHRKVERILARRPRLPLGCASRLCSVCTSYHTNLVTVYILDSDYDPVGTRGRRSNMWG